MKIFRDILKTFMYVLKILRDALKAFRDVLKTFMYVLRILRDVLKTLRDVLKTFRDAGSYMRAQYDARSLCLFARVLRGNHHKVPVSTNTNAKKYRDKEIQRHKKTKTKCQFASLL